MLSINKEWGKCTEETGSQSDAVTATVGWTGMHRAELKHWSALETIMRKLGDRNKESDEDMEDGAPSPTLMLKPNRRVMLSGAGASSRCSGREGAALVHLGQATQEDKRCGVYSAHSLGVEHPQSRPPLKGHHSWSRCKSESLEVRREATVPSQGSAPVT